MTEQSELLQFYRSNLDDAMHFYDNAVQFEKIGEVYGQLNNYSLSASMVHSLLQSAPLLTEKYKQEKMMQEKIGHIEATLKIILDKILCKVSKSQQLYRSSKGSGFGGSGGGDDDEETCSIEPVDFRPGSSACTIWFDSIIGMDDAKSNVERSVIRPILYPGLYPNLSKGILFYGPPGTGKTLLAKACVNELKARSSELDVVFYAPTGAELKGKYFGESEKKIKSLFDCASERATSLTTKEKSVIAMIFLDEVDSVAPDRTENEMAGTTVNALLQAIDGINSQANVTVIAATNYPWKLDGAFLRRFGKLIHIRLPDATTASEIIQYQISAFIKKTCGTGNNITVRNEWYKSKDSEFEGYFDTVSNVVDRVCKKPDVSHSDWLSNTYKKFINVGITQAEVMQLAEQIANQSYSNSDILNIWKDVVNKAGDKAYDNGMFVPVTQFPRKFFVPVSGISKQQFEYYKSKNEIVWLKNPSIYSVTVNQSDVYLHRYFSGSVLDPSVVDFFKNVFINDKKKMMLLEYEFIVEQKDGADNLEDIKDLVKDEDFIISLESLAEESYATLSNKVNIGGIEGRTIKGAYRREKIYFEISLEAQNGLIFSSKTEINKSENITKLLDTATAIYFKWEGDEGKFAKYSLGRNNAKKIFDALQQGKEETNLPLFARDTTISKILKFDLGSKKDEPLVENANLYNYVRNSTFLEKTVKNINDVSQYFNTDSEDIFNLIINNEFAGTTIQGEQLILDKNNSTNQILKQMGTKAFTEDIIAKIISARKDLLRFTKEFEKVVRERAVSFDFTNDLFLSTLQTIKPTAKKTDVELLKKYEDNPSTFKLEEAQKEIATE